jgi:hypothetical protein
MSDEIRRGVIAPLREETPDRSFWDEHSHDYIGRSWLDVPWYWAEAFFYRRMLQATRYFQPGEWFHRDPYANQKQGELAPEAGPRALLAILERLPARPVDQFSALLHASVWGNRADLSYDIARNVPGSLALEHESANLVVDHTEAVWEHLIAHRGGRVDFICDNAGTELLFDFALADWMLREGLASEITLHLKPQPFFVSDAMIQDAQAALAALKYCEAAELQRLAQRLEEERTVGHLTFADDPFWVTCLFFRELPASLGLTLAQAGLVISKGDANYRRLVGDRHWMPTTPFVSSTGYWPSSLVALRTLKSELIVGLRVGEAERYREQDPDWLTNGQRGVIQYKQ